MPPATPIQRPRDAAARRRRRRRASRIAGARPRRICCAPGDLVVANDAATLPASLAGVHLPTAAPIEVRLAGRASLRPMTSRVFRRSSSAPATTARAPRTGRRRRRFAAATGSRSARCARPVEPCSTIHAWSRCASTADRRDLGRHRAPRQADPVRARRRAARALGRVDARRGAAGRVRGAVGRLRARLAAARACAQRHRLRDADARGRPVVDRRRGARRAAAVRRALSPAGGDGRGDRGKRMRGAVASSRSARPSRVRSSSRRPHEAARAGEGWPPVPRPATPLRVVDAIISGTHEPGSSHHELLRAFVADECWRPRTRPWRRGATAPTSSATRYSWRNPAVILLLAGSAPAASGFLSRRK